MTWTYGNAPATSTRDAVRFLIRDTTSTDPLISDEEIAWLLSEDVNNVYEAAADACEQISAFFSRQGQLKRVGNLSIRYFQRSKEYIERARTLRVRSLRASSPRPYAGGISEQEKEDDADNEDLVQPAFSIGQFDNPGGARDSNVFNRNTPHG